MPEKAEDPVAGGTMNVHKNSIPFPPHGLPAPSRCCQSAPARCALAGFPRAPGRCSVAARA
eukprot:2958454-Pyramimonas_sp.AAC.1